MEYTIILQPWDDGQGYTVIVPSFPGCLTQDSTKEEALSGIAPRRLFSSATILSSSFPNNGCGSPSFCPATGN